jgi:isoquinoline 1-oxidoreductase alpha subunit
MTVSFIVNGEPRSVEADADTPLLWVLREQLGLTGTKFGCGIAACGACTVHLDGAPVRSCAVPLSTVEGTRVTTIEGLSPKAATGEGALHAVQAAWVAQQVPQCGYCQSGMIMAVAALLARSAAPTDAEIDAAITNICRCGTYERVRRAIRALAPGGEARHG